MKYAIFPLNIFLLPGEDMLLHIFEPRYKELLHDVEETNMSFGIYYQYDSNVANLGTMVNLKKVHKRYESGELDISVEASYLFRLDAFYEHFEDKLYSGGNITKMTNRANTEISDEVFKELVELFKERNTKKVIEIPTRIWDIAISLNLKSDDKLRLASLDEEKSRESFLASHIRFSKAILKQEKANQYNFHLN